VTREIVWRRLRGSRRASIGALLLALLAFVAIFADLLAGDAPLVTIGPEGTRVLPGVVHPERFSVLDDDELREAFGRGSSVWPLVRSGPERESSNTLASSSTSHPLGTDERGRDVFARLVFGVRTALGPSLLAILLSLVLGVALGGAAGFVSRAWDTRLERLVETVDTFPVIIVVALIRAIEGSPSALSLVVAVAIVRWAEVARLVRAEVLRASAEEYVLAARALGGTRLRVFARHIFPNAIGPVLVSSVFGIASIALLESAISFLQIGKRSNVASWGETLAEAARHPTELRLLLGPALLLLTTVGATYLLADSLRDAVDSKTPPRERVRPQDPMATGTGIR
jgi:peptide/nickel transport system permease protein